jgi:uroporphyrinogen-III synthase
MQQHLKNCRVVVTRSQPGAQRLAQQCTQYGATVRVFPTIDILPCENNSVLRTALADLQQVNDIIFTSAHAVNYCVTFCDQWGLPVPEHANFFAVGESTANVLTQQWGCNVEYPRQSFDSDALLRLPPLEQVMARSIAIVGGVGGRELLQTVLTQRGAKVKKIAVYERMCPQKDHTKKNVAWKKDKIDVIVATSVEGLCNLMMLLDAQERVEVLQIPLLVVGDRMREAAIRLGFSAMLILTAFSAQDHDIIKVLATWQEQWQKAER